jgi:hypothetical protein
VESHRTTSHAFFESVIYDNSRILARTQEEEIYMTFSICSAIESQEEDGIPDGGLQNGGTS